MIEPLQYNKEAHPAYEISRPVFCHGCLSQKNTKHDPNIAVKFCAECPTSPGQDKEYGAFLCRDCDEKNHKNGLAKFHIRPLLVTGPGVRKKVVVRGDGINFPLSLDHVAIKVKSRVYQNGRCVHKIPWKEMSFVTGMSGRCLHVQVLGARNLMIGDVHGSSDPFVVYSFCGKPLGTTRVRPRSTNPRWDNETFIVPMDENLPAPRDMAQSQKDIVRLEVYDYDWVTQNEFLGHVEITRSKLMKIAAISNQLPIRLPLTMKEYHGFINFQFGFDDKFLHIKPVRAENLNCIDARNLSNPYVKIYLGNSYLVGTSATVTNSINPQWDGNQVFKVKMLQLLFAERYTLSQIDAYYETQERLARMNKDTSKQYQSGSASQLLDEFSSLPTKLALFRIEIYHDTRWKEHKLLGKAFISAHKLRKMLPTLPAADIANMTGYTDYVVSTVRQDQYSAKMEALKLKKQTLWGKVKSCFGVEEELERPGSAEASRPSSPQARTGANASSSASGTAGAAGAASPARRRGNLLGAASAQGPPSAATASSAGIALPSPNPGPGVTFGIATAGFAPSVNQPGLELQNLNLPPSRRRKPLEISTAGFGSFSGAPEPATPSALSISMPGTPAVGLSGLSPMAPGGHAPLPQHVSNSSIGSHSANSVRSSPRPEVSTPIPAEEVHSTPLLPPPSAPPAEDVAEEPKLTNSDPEVTPEVPAVVAASTVSTAEQSMNAFMQQRSARPAPPPVSEMSERSRASAPASVASRVSLSITKGDEEVPQDLTDEPLLARDNTASSGRAPHFSDHSGSTFASRGGRARSLSRMISFRSPEITWSDSHPFPVMLDPTAHRGVDAFGNPVSQGFIVLRLIPATRGSVVVGLDEAVRQMTLGETANVKCRYDYAYGSFSMGSHIPPRANVIFKVKLLDINHRGRWDLLWRMFVRFMRFVGRLYILFTLYMRGEEAPLPLGQSSKKVKKQASYSTKILQRLGLSSRANALNSDGDSSEDMESDSDSDEEDGLMAGEGQDDGAESEDGSSVDSFQQYNNRPRVKPDPRMRKHLNQSVQSGAQIMWNFKPPKVVKKEKPRTAAPKKAESVALDTVAEDEGGGVGAGAYAGNEDADGENSNSDDEGERVDGWGRRHGTTGTGNNGIGFSARYSDEDNEITLERGELDNTYGSDDEVEEG